MAQSTTILPKVSMYQRFLSWRANRGRLTELDDLQQGDLTRIAADIGVSPAELRSLAATGAGSADLLPRRLASLGLDDDEIADATPGLLRDMERVCSFCGSKRRCAQDLDLIGPPWPAYCPNAGTLHELIDGRAPHR
jgi:hypothetical protein